MVFSNCTNCSYNSKKRDATPTKQKGRKMETSNNAKILNISLKRIELVKLIIACDCCETIALRGYDLDGGLMWMHLHDKLNRILEIWDDEHNTWND